MACAAARRGMPGELGGQCAAWAISQPPETADATGRDPPPRQWHTTAAALSMPPLSFRGLSWPCLRFSVCSASRRGMRRAGNQPLERPSRPHTLTSAAACHCAGPAHRRTSFTRQKAYIVQPMLWSSRRLISIAPVAFRRSCSTPCRARRAFASSWRKGWTLSW